jgi:hypothetical protein
MQSGIAKNSAYNIRLIIGGAALSAREDSTFSLHICRP